MSGQKTRHLYNNLCSLDDARYLEIGTWKGSTLCSAMYNNNMKNCIGIDNFSEFDGPRQEFLANFNHFKGNNNATFIEDNCWNIDIDKIGKFNIYVYDGCHKEESQFKALDYYYKALDDEFIYIVDDWNWKQVRDGTMSAIKKNNLNILYQKIIKTSSNDTQPQFAFVQSDWHNGIAIFVLRKTI